MQWKYNLLTLSYDTQFNWLYLIWFCPSPPFSVYFWVIIFMYAKRAISDTGYSSSTCSYLSLYNTITILKCQWAVSFWLHALQYGVTNMKIKIYGVLLTLHFNALFLDWKLFHNFEIEIYICNISTFIFIYFFIRKMSTLKYLTEV